MKNGKTRQSPSVERQLALTIRALLDLIQSPGDGSGDSQHAVVTDAQSILRTHGYENLESIPSRVKKIRAEMEDATEKGEWGKLAKLGTEMIRAEKGLPPLSTEKKSRKSKTPKTSPAAPADKKPRKKKENEPSLLSVGESGNPTESEA